MHIREQNQVSSCASLECLIALADKSRCSSRNGHTREACGWKIHLYSIPLTHFAFSSSDGHLFVDHRGLGLASNLCPEL